MCSDSLGTGDWPWPRWSSCSTRHPEMRCCSFLASTDKSSRRWGWGGPFFFGGWVGWGTRLFGGVKGKLMVFLPFLGGFKWVPVFLWFLRGGSRLGAPVPLKETTSGMVCRGHSISHSLLSTSKFVWWFSGRNQCVGPRTKDTPESIWRNKPRVSRPETPDLKAAPNHPLEQRSNA